ncbi:class I poly(R)-hydroxyalkanoic acid synthase [Psychromarinibacter sp. C21-152]|uniref:Class I poly(R)-hydroxyalkanoic acid synthase n=1 Tax=Psychromarinibacter sediminicola TaxID=3033385 RepID=A0AAE3NMN5_9RHOB|nr:class I poly(R)-hydroxyalkanoic acid synthase [Psychromarinibacter sediminicola]MDF0600133.1 class I poly(R)-hydroxyalkanoic acid synthase [Psychromarinibacter sediminicola]
MTTNESDAGQDLEALNANLAKMEELSQRLVAAMANKSPEHPGLQGPGQDLYMKAAAAWMAEMMSNPAKMVEQQVSYWGKTLKHYAEVQQKLAQGKLEAPEDTTPTDKRFADPLWQTHPYFNFLKQQYMLNAEAMRDMIGGIEGLDDRERRRIDYFSRQIIDLFSPTNFLATNPEALQKAVETNGQSLVDGLENLVRDIEESGGSLNVTLADKEAFKVGGNIATAPGKVVYRNRMFELIQYSPTTDEVRETPLIVFPPWINKYYIMDLKPQNSLIRWIVDQGYTLFIVSWVNPDETYADVGIDTYIEDGLLTAMEQVKELTGQEQINVVGYCIAGTTLSLALSYLHKKKDKSIRSATFFTALTDFTDQGEFTPFLTDDFVDSLEAEMKAQGYLDSRIMARTFSFLRSNDLVYQPAIRSYMMGEAPPAFDLLYWNGDGSNLPARMCTEYLRWLCQDNLFAKGELELMGETLSIKDVRVPLMSIACETDHIAAWKSCYNGVRQMGSRSKSFIVSESGHIAGIVNPPSKKKYGHYVNADTTLEPDAWLEGAEFHEGSWWPRWEEWLRKRSGKLVPARTPGDSNHPPLCDAPGTYVLAKTSALEPAG